MRPPPKFLFDECFGRPLVIRLREFLELSEEHVVSLLELESAGSGAVDDDWITTLSPSQWVVISADRGRRVTRGGEGIRNISELNGVFSRVVRRMR